MTNTSAFLVGIGSALGTALRYYIGQAIAKVNHSPFPWGTWIVNVFGTLLLGLVTQAFLVRHSDPGWWLLSGEGFCGGFTTFSTLSVETIALFRTEKLVGIVYLGSSLAVGLFFAWAAGWWF